MRWVEKLLCVWFAAVIATVVALWSERVYLQAVMHDNYMREFTQSELRPPAKAHRVAQDALIDSFPYNPVECKGTMDVRVPVDCVNVKLERLRANIHEAGLIRLHGKTMVVSDIYVTVNPDSFFDIAITLGESRSY